MNKGILKIISINPLFKSHAIKTKSIVQINSYESSSYDTVITAEMYYVFKKKYNLEYVNEKGKKREITFSIQNQKKEKALLEALKAPQGF